MQTEIRENAAIKESWSVIHPLTPEDSVAMTALRSAVVAIKGKLEGVAARGPFNGIWSAAQPSTPSALRQIAPQKTSSSNESNVLFSCPTS